ncbi:MAG: TerC/Alx family metal homeostasis membrane protein [Bacteroidota bacterium]
MNISEGLTFGLFIVFILTLLFIDLGVFSRKNHEIKFREALIWSAFWILLSVAFYFVILWFGEYIHGVTTLTQVKEQIIKYHHPFVLPEGITDIQAVTLYNKNLALEYITGYLIEKSLSVDNLFVMILIFFAFNVKKMYYKWVLFWGIIGALIMRFLFIFGSSVIIQRFEWFLYLFGLFLVFTGVKMFITRNKEDKKIDVSRHPAVRFASKFLPLYPRYVGNRFWIRNKKKKFLFTPLFLVLLVIEFSDVIFATDSVPAIFSVTEDPYIVFFSNVFAIMGLRSLFFLVLNVMSMFRFLKHGLSVLLTFIGLKLLFNHWLKEIGFTTASSLYIVLGILLVSIILSLIFPEKKDAKEVNA